MICAIENGAYRGFGEILPAIIANPETLHPVARRPLLRTLRMGAKRQRRLASGAKQRAQRYKAFIAQLDDPKHVATTHNRE
jgi:hypothetical protein